MREFQVGEVVRVKSVHGGVQKYVKGVIAKRLGPLNYLVKVGFRCRYTYVDHLIRSGEAGVSPEDCEEYRESATGQWVPESPNLPIPVPVPESTNLPIPVPNAKTTNKESV